MPKQRCSISVRNTRGREVNPRRLSSQENHLLNLALKTEQLGAKSSYPIEMARFLISFLAVAVACLFSTATSVPISTSNRGVQMAADFAIGSHNLVSKNANALKIIKIESVEYQIMPPSRAKYTMTVEVGKTVCKNVRGVNLADCALETGANAQTMTCNFVVLAVPNTDFSSYLLKDQCF